MSKIKPLYIHIFSLLLLVTICCLHIRAMDYICVLNDEFGYWAHAISAVGYDWRELISETPYYSWGYSIWLIPIIALLPSPELWYKAAIFLNVIFLFLSYCFCYKSGRKLFSEIDSKIIALISLIVIIYPSNVIYAQVAWSESLSYLLVWIEAYIIIKLDEQFSNKYLILSLLIPLYSFAVHNRNIGVLLAVIITVIFLLIINRKKIWYYFLLLTILVTGYRAIDFVKMHQINTLWSNSEASSINNVGIDTATITKYTSRIIQEAKLLFTSLIGKYFYILLGFELTFPIVIIRFVKDLLASIKRKNFFKNYFCSKLWFLLTAAAMFGICALQMNHWSGRKDLIVYGRYMENAFGPLLLLAITETIMYAKDARSSLNISFISIVICIFPVFYYIGQANGGFNSICSPVIGLFYKTVQDTPKTFMLISIFLGFIAVFLFISNMQRKQNLRITLILLCFGITYYSMGFILSAQFAGNRIGYNSFRIPIREKISDDLAEYEIYYIKNQKLDSTSINPKYLQYMIPDRTIHVILPEEMTSYISKSIILLTNPDDETSEEFLINHGAQIIEKNYLLEVFFINK